MRNDKNKVWQHILLAVVIASIGYQILLSTTKTGLVDMSIEATLFFLGSMIAFNGYIKSKKVVDQNFKKFQLFYGLTYSIVVISFIMGILYYIVNPDIKEIRLNEIMNSHWLMAMSMIKSVSMIFLISTWIFFYRFLKIKETIGKKIVLYFLGSLIFLTASMIVWKLTNDISVLSFGIVIGSVVGIFALISLDKRTYFLTIIFIIYSILHLIDFYMMGIGKDLTRGITNPVYWGVTVLYVLEVKKWIDSEIKERIKISG